MRNLLLEGQNTVVLPTGISRKLTLDGETKVYPVYQVRLDCLYYNDQNDRIASWISQYTSLCFTLNTKVQMRFPPLER